MDHASLFPSKTDPVDARDESIAIELAAESINVLIGFTLFKRITSSAMFRRFFVAQFEAGHV